MPISEEFPVKMQRVSTSGILKKLADFFKLEALKTDRLLSEYMVFGGYPRVILAETAEEKQSQMQEIYRSYVDRDIHALLHLEKIDAFNNLLKIIASQIGQLVSIAELTSTIGIDQKTVRHYLFYLEQTFLIRKVTPYFRNTRSEVTKAPLYYFVDVGFRNWLLGLFGLPEIPQPLRGHLFENVVFNVLKNQTELTPTRIHFWRTKDQAEVDFILEKGLGVIPIEVKYAKLSKLELPRSLRNFLTRYKPSKGFMIHIGYEGTGEIVETTSMRLLPFYKLILQPLEP